MKSSSRNGGQWTESRFHSFIKSALRSASNRWPPKFRTIMDSQVGKRISASSGRLAMHHLCASCGGVFSAREIQVDHIEPVIDPNVGFVDWDTVVERMFCEKEGYQVLCKPCHKIKTNIEKELTKKRKQNGK